MTSPAGVACPAGLTISWAAREASVNHFLLLALLAIASSPFEPGRAPAPGEIQQDDGLVLAPSLSTQSCLSTGGQMPVPNRSKWSAKPVHSAWSRPQARVSAAFRSIGVSSWNRMRRAVGRDWSLTNASAGNWSPHLRRETRSRILYPSPRFPALGCWTCAKTRRRIRSIGTTEGRWVRLPCHSQGMPERTTLSYMGPIPAVTCADMAGCSCLRNYRDNGGSSRRP